MDQRSRVAVVSGLLILCSSALWAATDAPRRAVVVWSGDDQWVKLERQDDLGAAQNDHPATLSTAAVASALGALRIRIEDSSAGSELLRPVFAPEELNRLAPQVAAGLSRAGPRQDVTFSTVGSHSLNPGGLMKDPNVNAGRVFYADGRLNVIFGELHANYRKKNVYGQRDQDFEPRRQGSRTKASRQRWTLAASPGIELHAANGGTTRNDWVIIDPRVAASQPAATAAVQRAEPPAAAVAPKPSPPAQAEAAAGRTQAANGELERRLQALKDLREKGLISDEAYEKKVQELLSEL